ncbi:hypothetical protein ACS0TY_028035 [Phlomoides rotata]
MTDEKIKIKVESQTSDFYVELKETDKVEDLMKIVKANWGDDYITLHHKSVLMESDKKLAAYNVKEGSTINVTYFADSLV